MDGALRVTNETNEVDLKYIFGNNSIANIPLFQRGYSWHKGEMDLLYKDILSLIDDDTLQSQFMGVVITFQQTGTSFGSPDMLDIVDGQQRIFSCYLILLAVQQIALDNNNSSFASTLNDLMYIEKKPGLEYNTKIMPPAQDRWQFAEICRGIANHKNIIEGEWGSKLPRPPRSSGEKTGKLTNQYKHIVKLLKNTLIERGDDSLILENICKCVLTKLGFVVITLKHPASAPVIFERLNSRGVKITTADLVRNEIFSRLSDNPEEAIEIFENHWKPFEAEYASYGVELDSLLWPYGLMIDSNIRKADLFNTLRQSWKDKSPIEIINDLKLYTPALLALKSTYELADCPQEIKTYIARFKKSNLPSSTYCFVLRAIQGVIDNTVKSENIVGAFDAMDSLLVRRACCGIEPSGLHAVFKGMWRNITEDGDGIINFASVKVAIGDRLPWPDDELFGTWVAKQPQYERKIAPYFIGQYEAYIARETPSQSFQIEHIIPQNPDAHWKGVIGDRSVKEVVNRYANLLPITGTMNKEESRKPYSSKRDAFINSMFASPRVLAEKYNDWNLETLEARSKEIAEWAVTYWSK